MPRTKLGPVSKNVRQQWLPEHMESAIKAACKKQKTLLKEARCFNIPKSTLASKMKKSLSGSDPLNLANEVLGRKPIFPAALEKQIVEYCMVMESRYQDLTRNDVQEMAFALAEKHGIKHPFKNEIAGRAWLDHFLNRHRSSISIRKPEATSRGRTLGFNKESVKKNFDTLDAEYKKHRYPPNRIFSVDATGLSIVQKIPTDCWNERKEADWSS